MIVLIALFISTPLVVSIPDELIFVQTLFRHGDRTPMGTYPTDPYQEEFWGAPWGELTTTGMRQQFLQGQRLKRLYVDKEQFLSAKYSRYETKIRSSDAARCLESAASQMAGFYSGSPTHPNDLPDWPLNWTPMPIETTPSDQDRVLHSGINCPRADTLSNARLLQKNFLDFIASKWYLIADILIHSGGDYQADYDAIHNIYGAITIEKGVYNLTLPDWITDDFYNALEDAEDEATNYVDGGAGFGYPEDTELLRLKAGFLLNDWIQNINNAIAGTKLKYYSYSGHESMLNDLMMVLHAKDDMIGRGTAEYVATISCEVWRKTDGYYLKFMYAADAYTDFVPFTRFISGCPSDNDFCPVDVFIARSQPYIALSDDECYV